MSRKATTSSVSWTRRAGTSPLAMRQNRQSELDMATTVPWPWSATTAKRLGRAQKSLRPSFDVPLDRITKQGQGRAAQPKLGCRERFSIQFTQMIRATLQHSGKRLRRGELVQESGDDGLMLVVGDGGNGCQIEVRGRKALSADFNGEVGEGQADLNLVHLDLGVGAGSDSKIGAQQEKGAHRDGMPGADGDNRAGKRKQAFRDRRSRLQHLEQLLRITLEDREVEARREHAGSALKHDHRLVGRCPVERRVQGAQHRDAHDIRLAIVDGDGGDPVLEGIGEWCAQVVLLPGRSLVKKAGLVEAPGISVVQVEVAIRAEVLSGEELAVRPGNEARELFVGELVELFGRDRSANPESS